MNKKETNPTFNDIRESYGLPRIENKDKEIERLNKRVEDLKIINEEHRELNGMLNKEIERLNNIIDKAIDYIDWQRRNPQYDNVWRNAECEDLIEILKGE